jgi:hypothetical protein
MLKAYRNGQDWHKFFGTDITGHRRGIAGHHRASPGITGHRRAHPL